MLKQRVITAVVLLAILLPALFWPSAHPFIAVILVLIAAGAWEFGRLNGLSSAASVAAGLACLALCAASWAGGLVERRLPLLWILSGAAWVLAGAFLLRGGVAGWPRVPRAVRVVAGVLSLWLAWLAASQARADGINFLLSVLVLVWVADIAAYFAGRRFGLRFTSNRLAPAISPGKSWEGVWGGMAGVLLLAVAWVAGDRWAQADVPSLYSRLAATGWWLLVLGAVFLAAMSVVGDLAESLIKRSAGAKDSSKLLPGHGGVLDRVDALLPTLPLAMMLASLAAR
ncbi:MAG: Phosphatidate cytidylyltransferase [uncultured Ramlibacter sp.]|uniref:Phosphatidate cytidylyltransferase n=1 Tax=uncultured Ramlibacter sp. TaxID=260755 RepID=A0A6J4P5A5_9BURK|nr:MAG: Phosphatidate cytidylyltransferase [uncultured Ramlibacter sp.]